MVERTAQLATDNRDPGTTDTPPELFELLADETRFAILRVLWDVDGEPLCFSELRNRTRIHDSGRFNYHLQRLTGTLVTETDGGYRLRPDAESVCELVFATESLTLKPRSAVGG